MKVTSSILPVTNPKNSRGPETRALKEQKLEGTIKMFLKMLFCPPVIYSKVPLLISGLFVKMKLFLDHISVTLCTCRSGVSVRMSAWNKRLETRLRETDVQFTLSQSLMGATDWAQPMARHLDVMTSQTGCFHSLCIHVHTKRACVCVRHVQRADPYIT